MKAASSKAGSLGFFTSGSGRALTLLMCLALTVLMGMLGACNNNKQETKQNEAVTPPTAETPQSSEAAPAVTQQISGAGATFPYPIYSKWADAYQQISGVGLNYQSIGSGGGIKQIEASTVTFGATDAPLGQDELDANGLVQWPMVLGGIVPVINLADFEAGKFILDGPALAGIYLGKIKKWNDPALVKLNPGVSLPDEAINVVYRSDGSGTTYNFTYYLSSVSEDFKNTIGTDKAVEWPVGMGAKGNEGVAQNVTNGANSIGYVEYAYAKQNKMSFTQMINSSGKAVSPSADSFSAAAASADWNSVPGYGVILANQPGEGTWPMTAATFILMHKKPDNDNASRQALLFFAWAYDDGDQAALDLDYIPMPDSVVSSVKASWSANIIGKDGQPLT